MSRRLAVFLLAVVLATPIARAADPLPADLGLVPGDALGFVHVRAKDLWASDLMSGLRGMVEKAGPKAAAAFDSQFYPAPSSIDRVTVILIPPVREGGPPVVPVVVVRFSESFDVAKLKALYFTGPPKTAGRREMFTDKDGQVAGYAADDRTLVLGDLLGLELFVTRPTGKTTKLGPALTDAAAGKHLFSAAVGLRAIPNVDQMLKGVPPVVSPLLAADLVTLTIGMDAGSPKVAFALTYPGEGEAKDAETAMKALCLQGKMELKKLKVEMEGALYKKPKEGQTHRPLSELPEAGAALVGLGGFAQLEDLLDNPPVKRVGTALTAETTIPKEMTAFAGAYSAIAVGLLLPAVQKVRDAAGRMTGANNLKQIGLAMYNYHDTYGFFPSAAPATPNGPKDPKKRLSWRVHLLPYIEQNNLYQQFKLDEPWDSEANKKAAEAMPKVYMDPRADAPPGMTYYKVFTGKDAMFDFTDRGRKILEITDGTSNTIMVVAGGDPVPWTKPVDIEFDLKKDLPDLGKPFGGGINVLMADGSVRYLQLAGIKPATMKAMITPNGGEVANFDNDKEPVSVDPSKPALSGAAKK